MFWPQPDRVPCWQISQAPVSSKRAVTGTVRSAPVLRPTVSSSVARVVRIPSLLRVRTDGLATYLPTTRSNRNFRNAFCSALVFMDPPLYRSVYSGSDASRPNGVFQGLGPTRRPGRKLSRQLDAS